jgi:hypothetical protein
MKKRQTLLFHPSSLILHPLLNNAERIEVGLNLGLVKIGSVVGEVANLVGARFIQNKLKAHVDGFSTLGG